MARRRGRVSPLCCRRRCDRTLSVLAHATAIVFGSSGVLLRGPSGSGKSMLAALMMERGARLVADDQVCLDVEDGMVTAQAPDTIAGKIELRGYGIETVDHVRRAVIRLVADLEDGDAGNRVPAAEDMTCTILGIGLPRVALPRQLSEAALVLRVALARQCGEEPPFSLR